MLITANWLKDFLDTNCRVDKIVETLNSIGLESIIVIDRKASLEKFTVAKIIDIYPHPEISKLQICQVITEISQKPIQVICGAENVKNNMYTVFAPIGSTIPSNGLVIGKRNIKGVDSFGMLCSSSELNLEKIIPDNEGIIDMLEMQYDNMKIGDRITDDSKIGDTIIDIEITPNRGDCLSIYGIARELAAKQIGTLKPLHSNVVNIDKSNMEDGITIDVVDTHSVPFFSLHKMHNLNVVKIPKWMQTRLSDVEIKLFNNALDIASYVSHSFGNPIHLHDANKLKSTLHLGKKNDFPQSPNNIDALDGNEYKIESEDIVHVSDREIITLSGIIGGAKTSISSNSKNIYVEVALFDKEQICKTGQRLQLNTDAKHKFERKVDFNMLEHTYSTFINMAQTLGSKIYVASAQIIDNRNLAKIVIDFNVNKVEKLLGCIIDENISIGILKSLGFELTKTEKSKYKVTVPSWRSDISIENDIVEEIARIYGYDNIKPEPIAIEPYIIQSNSSTIKKRIKTIMISGGYNEMYTSSFHDKKYSLFKNSGQDIIEIANPISSSLNILRNSLISTLIEVAKEYENRSEDSIAIFELGPVFNCVSIDNANSANWALGLIRAGSSINLYNKDRTADFFDVKGDVEKICNEIGISLEYSNDFSNEELSFLHPKCRIKLIILGKEVGYIGALHPKLLKDYEISNKNFIISHIVLDTILDYNNLQSEERRQFQPLIYQKVRRDFAFLVDQERNIGDAVNKIYTLDSELIQYVEIFDIFKNESAIPDGKKSFAIRVVFQSPSRTLNESDLNMLHQKIIDFMLHELGAEIRI